MPKRKLPAGAPQESAPKLDRIVTKADVAELKAFIESGFEHITTTLGERLDRIEFNTSGLERRVSIAEDRIRQLAVKSGLQFS